MTYSDFFRHALRAVSLRVLSSRSLIPENSGLEIGWEVVHFDYQPLFGKEPALLSGESGRTGTQEHAEVVSECTLQIAVLKLIVRVN